LKKEERGGTDSKTQILAPFWKKKVGGRDDSG